jgi:hypothetical protein
MLIDEEFKNEIETELLEYSTGASKVGAKYIRRLGSPGNYIYVYSNSKLNRASRRMRSAYKRLIQKNSKLFNGIKAKYEAKSFGVNAAKRWGNAVLSMNLKNGDIVNMYINLRNTKILGYRRSRRGVGKTGYPIRMSGYKKSGMLRYKGISI